MAATSGSAREDAIAQGAHVMVSTYNEPLITAEWAVAVFKLARAAGLLTGFVSNGNGTPQVLEYIHPHIDFYKVDLESFDDRRYHGTRRSPSSLFWIQFDALYRHGSCRNCHVLIPGFNDSVKNSKN